MDGFVHGLTGAGSAGGPMWMQVLAWPALLLVALFAKPKR